MSAALARAVRSCLRKHTFSGELHHPACLRDVWVTEDRGARCTDNCCVIRTWLAAQAAAEPQQMRLEEVP